MGEERRGVHRALVGKETTWETGVDGRTLLRWIFRKRHLRGMNWIELDEDSDRWRTLVNTVMNLRVP